MENALEPRHYVPRKKIKTQQQQDDLETYQHLPLGDSEIRLLDVEPAADESDIVKATLRTVSFAEDVTPRYNAVSYYRGSQKYPKKILLRCASGDWKNFWVSRNLHSLLQHLRLPDQPITFWIDAICIDQNNEKEKESQIGKMAQIYRKADEVSIWLGEYISSIYDRVPCDRETSKATIEFIGEVSKRGKDMVMQDHSSRWRDFILLMKVPWFSRRWVLQELAFARNPMMYFSKEKLPWETFKSAVEVFTNHFDAVLKISWPTLGNWDDRVFDVHPDRAEVAWANPLEIISLAAFMETAFEKNTQFPVSTLEELVVSMAGFQTSDPRDVIYALLSVAKDRLVEPDYTANVFQIYANFVEKVISTSGSLDIICRRWAANDFGWNFEEVLVPSPDDGIKQEPVDAIKQEPVDAIKQAPVKLSSWMRQTDCSIFSCTKYKVGDKRRCNPNPLVGMPGRSSYGACADRKASIRMGELRRLLELNPKAKREKLHHIRTRAAGGICIPPKTRLPSGGRRQMGADTLQQSVALFHTLYAKGVVIGTVSFDNGSAIRRSAFIKSVGDSFAQDPTPATVPEKLWRTLVGDRALGGGPAPGWYGDACLYCLTQVDHDPNRLFIMDAQDLSWKHYRPIRQGYCPDDVFEFRKRVDAVVYNQTAFDADAVDGDGEQLFGIGSSEIEAGDKVCILFGCSVPVILHPAKDMDGNECFRCLGESFVYSMMNGEALEGLTDDQVKEFAIV